MSHSFGRRSCYVLPFLLSPFSFLPSPQPTSSWFLSLAILLLLEILTFYSYFSSSCVSFLFLLLQLIRLLHPLPLCPLFYTESSESESFFLPSSILFSFRRHTLFPLQLLFRFIFLVCILRTPSIFLLLFILFVLFSSFSPILLLQLLLIITLSNHLSLPLFLFLSSSLPFPLLLYFLLPSLLTLFLFILLPSSSSRSSSLMLLFVVLLFLLFLPASQSVISAVDDEFLWWRPITPPVHPWCIPYPQHFRTQSVMSASVRDSCSLHTLF